MAFSARWFLSLAVFIMTQLSSTQAETRERISFNRDWTFQKTESSSSDIAAQDPAFDDIAWRKLDLPHDWGIEGPFRQEYPGETGKLPWWGTGWYRKHFTVPASDEGHRIFVDIDGAMSHSQVFLNGQPVGGWPYGYSSFRVELTSHLKFGANNVLAIRLDNPKDSSRWYPGGGIYRNVWLIKTSAVHIAHWGTFISTPEVDNDLTRIKIRVQLENQSNADVSTEIETKIFLINENGALESAVVASTEKIEIQIPAGQMVSSETTTNISHPQLWTLEKPTQYAAITTVTQDEQIVDSYETRFGIRTIQFTSDNGFLLNGKRVQLQGVCMHHDLGALGTAVRVPAMERQIRLLREMGCNAIRTSHNPPAPEWLDLCDRLGMLVIVEAFDCWKEGKKPNDYSTSFPEWHEKDLRAMIRRDRNHPSVILWSTGNEIPEQGSPAGHRISDELTRIVHDEDPTRLATAGCNHIEAGYNGFQNSVDIFGYNYKPGEYGKFRGENGSIPLYGSETSSCISSRGEYFFPVEEDKSQGRGNFQMSSYDLYAPDWAMPPDVEFKGLDQHRFVAGEFVWTGFDYLGEPTPYNADLTNLLNVRDPSEKAKMQKELDALDAVSVPSRSSYFGIIDLAGFPKDRFYLYQARWRPELRMAHILPHWTWPERVGKITPVHVYSSGDEAELFLNEKSFGRKHRGRFEYRFRWDDVVYEPGILKVVTWKKSVPWAEATMETAGPVNRLQLESKTSALDADGNDLAFVTVSLRDGNGVLVPRDDRRLFFKLNGSGKIIAVDNGDPTSHESFQAKNYLTFHGLCLVVIQSLPQQSGQITLEVASKNLPTATLNFDAR